MSNRVLAGGKIVCDICNNPIPLLFFSTHGTLERACISAGVRIFHFLASTSVKARDSKTGTLTTLARVNHVIVYWITFEIVEGKLLELKRIHPF